MLDDADGRWFGPFAMLAMLAVVISGLVDLRERRWGESSDAWGLRRRFPLGTTNEQRAVLRCAMRVSMIGKLVLPVLWAIAPTAVASVLAWAVVGCMALTCALRPKHTHTFLLAVAVAVAAAGASVFDLVGGEPIARAAYLPGAILLVALYANGAWHKARSPQFRSGAGLHVILWERMPITRRWQGERAYRTALSATAWAVIVVEAILPVGLFVGELRVAATAVGIVLHSVFLWCDPVRLAPFQVATVGTYACVWGLMA